MKLPSQEESLAVARELVAASAADETEVSIESKVERYVRYADSGPTQSADRERHEVAIRVRLCGAGGRREARATCDGLDPELTRAALARAIALAEVAPPNPELLPLGGAVQVGARSADPETLAHPFAEKAAWVRLAIDGCRRAGLAPAGLAQTSGIARALANSAGRAVHAARSRAAFSLTASTPGFVGSSGFAEEVGARVRELDPERAVRRAIEKAAPGQELRTVEPGEYTVVLEPHAVSSILLFAMYRGFGAQEVHEKSSFLCGRIGQRVFPSCLSVVDDASNDVFAGFPFDGEGSPRRRVPLIDRGVLGGPVTDSYWAERMGVPNTGHALAMPNTHGPMAENPVLLAGDASLEELIGGVERGLLVSQFHYTNLIDPRELTLTGVTRNGTFWIEGGRIAHPVRDLRFTQSLVGAFSNLSGVGRDLEVAGALFDGEVVCPPLRIERFRFTSRA